MPPMAVVTGLAEQIAAVDSRNPITASRMAKVFSRCSSYGPERQGHASGHRSAGIATSFSQHSRGGAVATT